MKKITASCAALVCLLFAGGLQAAAPDGSAVFKERCAGCHGAEGQTPKGNAKDGIKMYSAEEVRQKLRGYEDGTYGGGGKSVMRNVARNLTPDQMQAVADYVGSLKK